MCMQPWLPVQTPHCVSYCAAGFGLIRDTRKFLYMTKHSLLFTHVWFSAVVLNTTAHERDHCPEDGEYSTLHCNVCSSSKPLHAFYLYESMCKCCIHDIFQYFGTITHCVYHILNYLMTQYLVVYYCIDTTSGVSY